MQQDSTEYEEPLSLPYIFEPEEPFAHHNPSPSVHYQFLKSTFSFTTRNTSLTTMAMNKLTRSQIALSLLASLITLTPLFSSSLRPTYIYFIFNLLIIALGAEAGLLFSNPNPNPNYQKKSPEDSEFLESPLKNDETRKMESRTIQKCSSQKVSATKKIVQVRKCSSSPCIFSIDGGEVELQEQDHNVRLEIRDNDIEEEEDDDVAGGQELFTKAEDFIGNFYKQLNMQREESWKKIHGFYIS